MYKCIIIDDEPIAIRIIKKHLSAFSDFEIVAECNNALEDIKQLVVLSCGMISVRMRLSERL